MGAGGSEAQALTGVVAPPPERDAVNHPSHYNSHPSGIECIDIVEHMPFNVGNAVKYVWRAGLKDSAPAEQDFAKAIWYLKREVDRLKKLGVLP